MKDGEMKPAGTESYRGGSNGGKSFVARKNLKNLKTISSHKRRCSGKKIDYPPVLSRAKHASTVSAATKTLEWPRSRRTKVVESGRKRRIL